MVRSGPPNDPPRRTRRLVPPRKGSPRPRSTPNVASKGALGTRGTRSPTDPRGPTPTGPRPSLLVVPLLQTQVR